MVFPKRNILWFVAFVVSLMIVGGYEILFAPPTSFPSGSMVSILPGASAPAIAQELANTHLIAHPSLLRLLLRLSGKSESLHAGTYLFIAPENLFAVAYRLTTGDYGLPRVRLTFVEGVTVREMAAQIADAFPNITAQDFLAEAKPYEGYLFPDTYFFPPSADTASVIALMRDNFDAKTVPLARDIQASGRSLSDTVILASLIEKEARTTADREIVAGILLNRLKAGMPLQVDAVFGYIKGRDTYSPSLADLAINSPYNTYLHKGLPPGPIDNPGLDSLEAAANPAKTKYLYYLTDKNGVMHYATTYAEHHANQNKYLH